MNSPLRIALAAGVALGLSGAAFAQEKTLTPPPLIYPPAPPTEIREIVYDWSEQRIVSNVVRPVAAPRSFATPLCFDNSRTAYVWSLFNRVNDEIVDWGVKSCAQTNAVTSFTFGYISLADDPSIGGPGAAMTWALYEGTDGFGHLGDEIARLTFTGMPGTLWPGGQSMPHFVTVDLSDAPLVVPDGNIGWSFMNIDGQSGPILAFAPTAELGIRDALDVYTPGPATDGHYTGTFNWAGSFMGSFFFQLEEDPGDVLADAVVVNGTGYNPEVFSSLTLPVLGTNWLAMIDMTAYPTSPASIVVASSVAIPPTMTRWGEVLIDPLAWGFEQDLGYSLHSMDVPLWPALAGLVWHTQGAIFLGGGSVVLVNGIDLTLGW